MIEDLGERLVYKEGENSMDKEEYEELKKEMSLSFLKDLCRVTGGNILDSDNIYWKLKDGEWIGKPSVQTKDLRRVWLEDVNPEDIDDRYYNLDGTKK